MSSVAIRLRPHAATIQLCLLMVLLVALIYGVNPRFLSATNLSNLLGQMVTLLVVSLGMTVIVINGEFDISVGSIVGLSGACMGWLLVILPQQEGWVFLQESWPLLFAVGIVIPLLVGPAMAILSGCLVLAFRVPSFIVTLGMLMIGRSLTLVITGGQPIADVPAPIKAFGVSRPFSIPSPFSDASLYIPSIFLIAGIVYFVGWFVMSRTAFGRKVYAVGANPVVARLAGINVTKTKLLCFGVVGLCASIAGVLNVARIGAVSPNSGQGLEFEVIAAVVIGGTSLTGGKGSVLGTILGVIIIVMIRNFLNLARIDIFWQDFATGSIIMTAVLLNAAQKRLAERK